MECCTHRRRPSHRRHHPAAATAVTASTAASAAASTTAAAVAQGRRGHQGRHCRHSTSRRRKVSVSTTLLFLPLTTMVVSVAAASTFATSRNRIHQPLLYANCTPLPARRGKMSVFSETKCTRVSHRPGKGTAGPTWTPRRAAHGHGHFHDCAGKLHQRDNAPGLAVAATWAKFCHAAVPPTRRPAPLPAPPGPAYDLAAKSQFALLQKPSMKRGRSLR